MSIDRRSDRPAPGSAGAAPAAAPAAAGKRTLTETAYAPDALERGGDVVQREATPGGPPRPTDGGAPADIANIARAGTRGGGGPLPHLDLIQASFGRHDVSGVRAHQGGAAAEASQALGAQAYALGDAVAFGGPPDLHTAAHEAAHVVQQRGGVQLKGGLDQPGDAYERHADDVADAVVAGRSAEGLLDRAPGGGGAGGGAAVQRQTTDDAPPAGGDAPGPAPAIAPPTPAFNQVGFIDHGDGANLRTGPAEAGGQLVRPEPLPPATRVFVTGTHPDAPEWHYVTAALPGSVDRGYLQGFRVTRELPEPMAELHQVESGDTAEGLAQRMFGGAVTDGHDLRFYENVLLYVNQQQGRAGITGTYQSPNVVGGGSNNIQLVAGHRIWLVSAAYATTLESLVPSGSLTGGAVAQARRFAGHIEDILQAATESPSHFAEVAGEMAEAIREHSTEILGIVAAFITAEALSAGLAASPTGVGQLAAALIQLLLAFFGAQALVQATIQATEHAVNWMSIAWNASGDPEQIAAASREFVRMLVAIAMAALAYTGMSGNATNSFNLMSSAMRPPPMAAAVVGGGTQALAGTGADAAALAGPYGGLTGTAVMMSSDQSRETSGQTGGASDSEPVTIMNEAGTRPIGEFSRGNYLRMLIARGRQLFGGNEIALAEGKTTTVTGTLEDVNTVAARGADRSLGVTVMGENPGGINILRSPQWRAIQDSHRALLEAGDTLGYWRAVTDEFWETVNRPWLDEAIARGDNFRFVSNPLDPLKTSVTQDGAFVLDTAGNQMRSIFGRELDYLQAAGYDVSGRVAVKVR